MNTRHFGYYYGNSLQINIEMPLPLHSYQRLETEYVE
jgi:hypothetical protein